MENNQFNYQKRQQFVRFLLLTTLVLFCFLIKDYIVSLVLAVIFSGLLSPVYKWVLKGCKKRKALASAITIVLFVLLIVVPFFLILVEIINQASFVSKQIFPFIKEQISTFSFQEIKLPTWLPFSNQLEPYTGEIFTKISQFLGGVSNIVVKMLTNFTQGTFVFFLNAFVMLYAMYYFLISGNNILNKANNYLPLTKDEFNMLAHQVISISRATIKGAFFIGIIQGFLVGVGFWFVGLPGAVFWGAVATIISIIPSIGTSLVYIPAAMYLLIVGKIEYGIGLFIWGVGIVSTIDNILRPKLVGKDTQMSDVLILVTSLGGIGMFGISGIIIGPLIAGVFISLLNIYKKLFVAI
ncbi:AI-2E family transporter [Tenacibaculum sp. UWU-22]|uniref:AI-2E family transporter n=1 Tax=Tenacibaculum sp. UWU-22 TaxID=3234187 RepID=UPI0034DAD3B5